MNSNYAHVSREHATNSRNWCQSHQPRMYRSTLIGVHCASWSAPFTNQRRRKKKGGGGGGGEL